MNEHPLRNLGMDLVRVTEAAALSAGRWMGLGKQNEADLAAAQVMYDTLKRLDMDGRIVIGEDKLPDSPLTTGQRVGSGNGPKMDVVLDPIEGRDLLGWGRPGAISVAGVAPRGTMWSPSPAVYMEKIVVDSEVAAALVPECLDAPAAWTLAMVARLKKKAVRDLVVFLLDRPRHRDLIEEVRSAGARAMLRSDGDVAGALLAADPNSGVDLMMGVGGVSEGMIAACAVKTMRGGMLGRLAPQSDEEQVAVKAAGLDMKQILSCSELVTSDDIFFSATGITNGILLSGVNYHGSKAETESLLLRGETGARRFIRAEHRLG